MSEVKKSVKEDGVIEYGTPGYTFELQWHDIAKKDELVVTGVHKTREIMNARAKGTTIYEIIDMYGGIDEVTAATQGQAEKAVYADVSDVPDFANDEAYEKIINDLAKAVAAQQAQKEASVEGQVDEENKEEVNNG